MFIHPPSPVHKRWAILIALLACAIALPSLAKDKKNAQPADPKPDRLLFDIRKLVWPNPPAVARIRYVAMLTGEKIDHTPKNPNQKAKKSWMDRLAGAQPIEEQNIKIPIQFIRVFGVAVDSHGDIYAADQGVDAIFIVNSDSKAISFIRNGHEARFGMINGLAMDDGDRLFVSDTKLRKILVFNAKHEQEASFGAEMLVSPAGIAIDKENRFLYVVDTQKDQVLVFDADNYKLLRTIGTTGKNHQLTDPGNFALPTNVAVDKEGDVYVTDTLNNRVEIFDADGNFISTFGKAGDGAGQFERPKGIAVDCDGHIWVVDGAQNRFKVFDRQGRLLIYIGETGTYPGQFDSPYGIAIDKDNRVIVSEQFPGRVQVFKYVTDAEAEKARSGKVAEASPSPTPAPAPPPAPPKDAPATAASAATKGSAAH